MEQSLIEGKPYQKIIQFTLPILVGSLFQQFYNMADAFIISRTLGVEPLRALGITMTTFTAQNYGAGKYTRVRDGVRQSIVISILLSLVLGAIMLFGGRWLTQMFIGNVNLLILDSSHTFLIIHGVLYIILGLLFIFRYTLQGLGYTFVPTVAGTMELVMRVIAAFFLVPTFEFAGASFATPLSWAGALLPIAISYYFASCRLRQNTSSHESAGVCI